MCIFSFLIQWPVSWRYCPSGLWKSNMLSETPFHRKVTSIKNCLAILQVNTEPRNISAWVQPVAQRRDYINSKTRGLYLWQRSRPTLWETLGIICGCINHQPHPCFSRFLPSQRQYWIDTSENKGFFLINNQARVIIWTPPTKKHILPRTHKF